ncbi:hypothetical protein D3C80_1332040 [compost metagenome]
MIGILALTFIKTLLHINKLFCRIALISFIVPITDNPCIKGFLNIIEIPCTNFRQFKIEIVYRLFRKIVEVVLFIRPPKSMLCRIFPLFCFDMYSRLENTCQPDSCSIKSFLQLSGGTAWKLRIIPPELPVIVFRPGLPVKIQ